VSVGNAPTFIITNISLTELQFEASERKENYMAHLLYENICISQHVLNLFIYLFIF
jgi:hypothetical protein